MCASGATSKTTVVSVSYHYKKQLTRHVCLIQNRHHYLKITCSRRDIAETLLTLRHV
jgi:hypothetical protein